MPSDKPQMDLFSGLALRDEALEVVADKAGKVWMEAGFRAIAHLEGEFTGEDIRRIVGLVIGQPHHHNAWGSLIMNAIKRGLIIKTGQWLKMRDPRSHARMTPVYRNAE